EVEPLRDTDPAPARTDRRRRRRGGVPDVLLEAAAKLDLVAMPVARDEPGHGAVHLDHRVVGGRRAVDDALGPSEELAERETFARGEAAEADHHALALVVERSRRLVEVEGAVGPHEDEIGEGAADVDPDPVASLGAARRLLDPAEAHAFPRVRLWCDVVRSTRMCW